MIARALTVFFIFSATLISAYLVRHYVFTLTVLRRAKNNKKTGSAHQNEKYTPTVSILIPARNEEKVLDKLLQKMTELVYPKTRLEVVVIEDASTDGTGRIAVDYAKRYFFIKALHRSSKKGGKGKAGALNAG
jgi:cellulose synthase/poly-beta-1,6-N-acetylglucosamine synthase-like glycosyltransferase